MPEIRPVDILRALDAGELEFFYQPKVSFVTGKVSGCEALLRWRRPNGSYVLPGEFLPMIERSGLITQITQGMFPILCRDQTRLNAAFDGLHLGFNVSAHDLENDQMTELVMEAIRTGLLSPGQIQIELTETAVAGNKGALKRNLESLVDAGMALAMDDFGTGYSSLDTLHQLPFSVVKIDQGVVKGMLSSSRCAAIVMAGIRLAHEMDLTVVAEGVETAEAFELLHHSGCTEAQGYWICRPKPLEQVLAFLAEDPSWCEYPIGMLRQAEMDHIQWRGLVMDRVLGVRIGWMGAEDRHLSLDLDQCRFGRWFYGTGRRFAGDPAYDALEEPHRRLHQIAIKLLKGVEELGLPPEAMQAQSAALLHESERLLRLLQELEIKAMLGRPPWNREASTARPEVA